MKKNILTKILLSLLVVLLAFSIAACSKPQAPNEPAGNDDEEEEVVDANLLTKAQVMSIVNGFEPYIDSLGDVADNDTLHIDVNFAFQYDLMQYTASIKANIYPVANCSNNQIAIEVKDITETKDINIYLANDAIYLDQDYTANNQKASFTKLDGLELSKNLSTLVAAIALPESFDFDAIVTEVGGIADFVPIINGIGDGLLSVVETDDMFTINVETANMGDLLTTLLGDNSPLAAFGIDLTAFQDYIDFGLQFLFGVESANEIAALDASALPTIEISFPKDGTAFKGLGFEYVGNLDTDDEAETISFAFNASISGSTGSSDAVDCDIPSFTNFEESVITATLDIDLGVKDLALKATVIADPNFVADADGSRPTAYLTVVDGEDNAIANLDAAYDGETLYFDLAGLYTFLEVTPSEETETIYCIDFNFFGGEVAEPQNVELDPEEDEEEEIAPPFVITNDYLGVTITKIYDIIGLLQEVAESKSLSISVDTILGLLDGYLFVPAPEKVDDEWVASSTAFGVTQLEAMITDFVSEELIQEMITDFTGVTDSLHDLLTATGDDAVSLTIALIDDGKIGLSIVLDNGAQNVIDASLTFDLADASTYAYDTEARADWTGAIDLNSEEGIDPIFNIYYVEIVADDPNTTEINEQILEKHYKAEDCLLEILDAYKAYGSVPA